MTRDTGGDREGARSPGPFPDPQTRDSPWQASETERGPFERRRGVSRRALAPEDRTPEEESRENRRRRGGRRKSDVLTTETLGSLSGQGRMLVRRFREPLIGLTLAGVAAPLINAGLTVPPEEANAEDADARVAGERDLDTEVGDYWAEAAEEVVRNQTIEGATIRYGISHELAEKIYESSARYDIEPDVAFGLVKVESMFRERAVSHVGARGLAQVMPRTARWLDPTVDSRDLFEPEVNLDLGFRYLRQMIDKYDGDLFKALTAYNRGPGTVDRILRRGGNIDNGYAGKVMAG
jgi:hypothetical protein